MDRQKQKEKMNIDSFEEFRINEGKQLLLRSEDKNSELPSAYPEFTVINSTRAEVDGTVIAFIPKTSKDLDKIDSLGNTSKLDICKQLAIFAMKKTKMFFVPFEDYVGAGYAIKLDMTDLVKKLGR